MISESSAFSSPSKLPESGLSPVKPRGGETGKSYCQTLANVAGTEVIAADASQIVTIWQGIKLFVAPYGNVDDFEGTVYSFNVGEGHGEGVDPEANYRSHMSGASTWDE
jgi:hypothetical protein